jgi:nicotinamidase-related amidase
VVDVDGKICRTGYPYSEEKEMKPALLVIDVQKAFFDFNPKTTESLNNAIEYINAAIALFREKGLPVISVQHLDEEDQLAPGNPGFDLPESLKILPDDLHIHKTHGNAFRGTGLVEKLNELGVDTVIVTGFCAEYCVLSAYKGAEDLDLHPIMLRGGLASFKPENITFVESICDVISYGALKQVI